MAYTLSHPEIAKQVYAPARGASLISRFFTWAANEDEERHIAWVGISVTSMAAFFLPLTMAAILINGAFFSLIIGAAAAFALVVITNLAGLSTKYTIPLFFLAVLADFVLVILSFLL